MSSMQALVNVQQAPAVAGDWASTNPRTMYVAGPGGLVAGASGVYVARWAWVSSSPVDWDGAPQKANSTGSGVPDGFVHREQQALITTYLSESGMLVPQGFGVTLARGGDLWVANGGSGAVTVGMKAYAMTADGTTQFAAAGGSVSGGVETAFYALSAADSGGLVKMGTRPGVAV